MVTKAGFPGSSDGKESDSNAEDLGSVPGLGRSPRKGNGNPLPYSCLENPTEEPARLHTVHGIAKSRTQLSNFHSFTHWLISVRASHVAQWYTEMQETWV